MLGADLCSHLLNVIFFDTQLEVRKESGAEGDGTEKLRFLCSTTLRMLESLPRWPTGGAAVLTCQITCLGKISGLPRHAIPRPDDRVYWSAIPAVPSAWCL